MQYFGFRKFRSHCILTIHVESRLSGSGGQASELRLGKMHLVDLAGSERLKLSGAEGDTLTETQNINLSLTALGEIQSTLELFVQPADLL